MRLLHARARVREGRPTSRVSGRAYERLHGVFGARMRVVRLRLGDERLELTEYLAPRGRPMPPTRAATTAGSSTSRSSCRDMDRAYARLREHGVAHASTGPQRLPDWNPGAGGIQAFYFRDPDGHFLEILQFPPARATRVARARPTRCSSASITPPSSSTTPTRPGASTATAWA